MNEYLQAVILGVVQGISEFLPISSDGHLVIVKNVLGWCTGRDVLSQGNEFEVLLHLGTFASILAVYAHDLRQRLWDVRLWGLVALATVPAVVIGLTLEDWFDAVFDDVAWAGYGLLATAALLWMGQRWEHAKYDLHTLPWHSAAIIGCFQALALLPGLSRSGSTISSGLMLGVDRIAATRFSFFMAIPVTAGAIALKSLHALRDGGTSVPLGATALGIVVSFLVGCAALKALIRLMTQRKLHWFAGYCLVMGLATIVAAHVMDEASRADRASQAAAVSVPADER
jgi:undecaprenyl-diphosphatase